MIKVTKFNGMELFVNAELIEFIETTPDTVLTLINGTKLVLKESAQEIVDRIIDYRKAVCGNVICRIETHHEGSGNCTR